MTTSYQSTAQRVIRDEATALEVLAQSIGPSFDEAVRMILDATGRVIVCGMGKSGHIARKIAATLASTGTPAHFVHPAEASHGDLGMVAKGDVAMILSNSGETPELADMIAHTRRFRIPMIGVASVTGSNLMRQADVQLLLPQVGEACGTGVVPTNSTTMTLALGDALAVALMEHRSFTAAHFRDFHPGGKLGARLAKVRDLMHGRDAVPLIAHDKPLNDMLAVISEKGFGAAGVVDGERLVGIVTDGDLRRNLDGLLTRTIPSIMTKDPIVIGPDALAEKAIAIMNERQVTSLFVTDDDRSVLGLIHIHDCLRAGLG